MSTTITPTAVKLPAGTYFVGDPCYCFKKRWDEVVGQFFSDPSKDRCRVMTAEIGGQPIAAVSTMYGDGSYEGDDGFSYPVDAGILGVVPCEIAERNPNTAYVRSDCMRVVTFDDAFEISRTEDGVVSIGHIEIITGDERFEDEDEECERCGMTFGPGELLGGHCEPCERHENEEDEDQ